jgi:hypothetical protein
MSDRFIQERSKTQLAETRALRQNHNYLTPVSKAFSLSLSLQNKGERERFAKSGVYKAIQTF